MGIVGIFWKYNIQKASLRKTSIVGKIVLFCWGLHIILLNLTQFSMLWTESNLERPSDHNSAIISNDNFALDCKILASRAVECCSFIIGLQILKLYLDPKEWVADQKCESWQAKQHHVSTTMGKRCPYNKWGDCILLKFSVVV